MDVHGDWVHFATMRRRELLERGLSRAALTGTGPSLSLRARVAGSLRRLARRLEPADRDLVPTLRLLANGELNVEQALRLIP
jgi:hypothetical protein